VPLSFRERGFFVGRAGKRLLGAKEGRRLLGETAKPGMALKLGQQFGKFRGLFSGKRDLRSVNQIEKIGVLMGADTGDRRQIKRGVANYDESEQGKRREFIL
jgi:hypothetical protein